MGKYVFLFGAGSTMGWGAPSTHDLTKITLEAGFPIKGHSKKVTQAIYEQLTKEGFSESDVNFETIINVIEEMIVYYSEFDSKKQLPSLMRTFYDAKFDNNILNFSIKGGTRKHDYQLQIPEGVDYHYGNFSLHGETPEQFYFQHLLLLLLQEISERISDYAFHAEGNSTIDLECCSR